MKILKYFITLLFLFILFPALSFAATDDFTAGSDITVHNVTFGDNTADMFILSGSTAESWTFDDGTFTVTNPGTFKVGSSDSSVESIQIIQDGDILVCSENTSLGVSSATVPDSSGTYTIKPSTIIECTKLCAAANAATYNSYPDCEVTSCEPGYRLSGSGASATCVSIGGGGGTTYGFSSSASEDSASQEEEITKEEVTKEAEVKESIAISAIFNSTLTKGMIASDIERLQKLFNTDSDTQIAASGVGSAGHETNYFGSLTERAVQKFQAKYDVVSSGTPNSTGYGVVGPKTRAKLQEVFGERATTETTSQLSESENVSENVIFNSTLTKGMIASDIERLQKLFNTDSDTQIAVSGVGSAGHETNYFGSLTERAVQKFQAKYDVVSSGTPNSTGYGVVGPKTRAKLQEVFGERATTETTSQLSESENVSENVIFNSTLTKGMIASDIERLQKLFNTDSDIQVAASGVGSVGHETNYFGSLTERAVQKFQAKYDVVSSGTPNSTGYGVVGPKTRAKLQEVFGQ